MKIYISGAITNNPNYKQQFQEAEQHLKQLYPNAIILNPTILPEGLDYNDYMHIDMAMIEIADMIYFIEGWEESKGANIELCHAIAHNKKIVYLDQLISTNKRKD